MRYLNIFLILVYLLETKRIEWPSFDAVCQFGEATDLKEHARLSKLLGCMVLAMAMATTGLIGASSTKSGAAKDPCTGTKSFNLCVKVGGEVCSNEDYYVQKANDNNTYDAIMEKDGEGNNAPVTCAANCAFKGGNAIKPKMGPTYCNLMPKKAED